MFDRLRMWKGFEKLDVLLRLRFESPRDGDRVHSSLSENKLKSEETEVTEPQIQTSKDEFPLARVRG